MSLGQVAEVLLMILLFPCLRRFGMRFTIFLGYPCVARSVRHLRYW